MSWHAANSPNTTVYEDYVLLALINATIEDVSLKEGLAYDRVVGIVERRIAARVDRSQYHAFEILGLDEIALKKFHE